MKRRMSIDEETYWMLEKERVELRLDSIEDLIWELLDEDRPARVEPVAPRVGGKGRSALQVLDVIEIMEGDIDFGQACESVADNYNLTSGTVRDSCTRRLGLTTQEFRDIVADAEEKKNLIEKLRADST